MKRNTHLSLCAVYWVRWSLRNQWLGVGCLDGCWLFEWILAIWMNTNQSMDCPRVYYVYCSMRCLKYIPMRCSKHCPMRHSMDFSTEYSTGYSMMLFIMISDYDFPAQVKDWTTVFDSSTYWSSHCAINRYLAYFNVSSIDCCKNTCHRCHLAKILIETASNRVI